MKTRKKKLPPNKMPNRNTRSTSEDQSIERKGTNAERGDGAKRPYGRPDDTVYDL